MKNAVALLLLSAVSIAFPALADELPAGVLPAMSRSEITAGLESRDRALYIKEG